MAATTLKYFGCVANVTRTEDVRGKARLNEDRLEKLDIATGENPRMEDTERVRMKLREDRRREVREKAERYVGVNLLFLFTFTSERRGSRR